MVFWPLQRKGKSLDIKLGWVFEFLHRGQVQQADRDVDDQILSL